MATTTSRGPAFELAPSDFPNPAHDIGPGPNGGEQAVVLGGGCFWCVEAVFKELDGVTAVRSGYAGGTPETANYRDVCGGDTGHAEVIEVRFDPKRITFGEILKIFFAVAHDPTQVDRQGNDRGPQYRSAIFHTDAEQKAVAEAYIAQLDAAGAFASPIVTKVEPLPAFHEAEPYHQDYAARNPSQPYVAYVAEPKVQKLKTWFGPRLKRG